MAKESKFNKLIEYNPELAAGILQQSFIHVVNNVIPGIYLTKDEYKKLIAIILAGEAKDPDEAKPEDYEPPAEEEGGDDTPGGDDTGDESGKDDPTTGGTDEGDSGTEKA